MEATLTFLGTGTSMGVPTLGCDCAVCTSHRPPQPPHPALHPSRLQRPHRPHRYRSRLPRPGPARRTSAASTQCSTPTATPITSWASTTSVPSAFTPKATSPSTPTTTQPDNIERIFEYTFRKEDRYPTSARVQIHRIIPTPGSGIEIFGACFQRIPVTHGRQEITGYRFGTAAYLTDMSDIPEVSMPLLQDLDVLIVDALRHDPHPSHSHLEKSIAIVEKLKPRRAFFTHMGHELDHDATNAALPPHIRLAYDGLQINFEIA